MITAMCLPLTLPIRFTSVLLEHDGLPLLAIVEDDVKSADHDSLLVKVLSYMERPACRLSFVASVLHQRLR